MHHGIKRAGGKIQMSGNGCIKAIVNINQTMDWCSPHGQNYDQGQYKHRDFDENRVNFDITVIGYKKEGKRSYKVSSEIQNLYSHKSFVGVGTGHFQKISNKINNDHGLHEQEIIPFTALAPKESVDPNKKGQGQSNTDNKNQNNIYHFFLNSKL